MNKKKISGTINSILSQSYEGEIEIIIVDGMSNDGTRGNNKQLQRKIFIYKNY